MTYGEAIEHLKEGKVVTREAFEDEFRFKLKKGKISKQRFEDKGFGEIVGENLFERIRFGEVEDYPQIICMSDDGNSYRGWLLNDVDILAHDWKLSEEFPKFLSQTAVKNEVDDPF